MADDHLPGAQSQANSSHDIIWFSQNDTGVPVLDRLIHELSNPVLEMYLTML